MELSYEIHHEQCSELHKLLHFVIPGGCPLRGSMHWLMLQFLHDMIHGLNRGTPDAEVPNGCDLILRTDHGDRRLQHSESMTVTHLKLYLIFKSPAAVHGVFPGNNFVHDFRNSSNNVMVSLADG